MHPWCFQDVNSRVDTCTCMYASMDGPLKKISPLLMSRGRVFAGQSSDNEAELQYGWLIRNVPVHASMNLNTCDVVQVAGSSSLA